MSNPFLTANDNPISLGQSLRYLQRAGKLQGFIGDILRQYVIEQELQSRSDLEVNAATIEQAVINFRLERNLTEPDAFQQWLEGNRMTYNSFHDQVGTGIKLEMLKLAIVQPQLETYFQERKPSLDAVVLSRIVLEDYELAEALSTRLQEQGERFEELAREYSIGNERNFNGMMGAVSWATLPPSLKQVLLEASPGQILSPLDVEGRWCIFRVEQFLEVSLENPQLRQQLQNELFEAWINEQLKTLTVKLQINE